MKRVLIVDDDLGYAEYLTERLKSKGYIAVGATLQEDAERYLASYPFDVILVDYKMPFMDGDEFLLHVKESYPNLKRVLMTANILSMPHPKHADFYFEKPSSLKDYALKIEEVLHAD